jgi:hypothetical protein
MFVKISDDLNGLVFLKSRYINVFPCGRRRSNLVDADGQDSTRSDRYYIPFDPEARLNTEANNRKHSGLSGFKRSYLYSWDTDKKVLSLVIDGYLFTITLSQDYATPAAFGAEVARLFNSDNDIIFANIKLANVEFWAGGDQVPKAYTEVLRDQTLNATAATCLDLLVDGADAKLSSSYYFSGLSLSMEDMSNETDYISLPILVKRNATWQINNKARLPVVEHGDAENSIKLPGDLEVNNITAMTVNAKQLKQNNHKVTLLDIEEVQPISDTDKPRYRLRFTGSESWMAE